MNCKWVLILSVSAFICHARASEFSEIHWSTKCRFAVGFGTSLNSFVHGEFSNPENKKVDEKLPLLRSIADSITGIASQKCKESSDGNGGTPFYNASNQWYKECNKLKDDKLNNKCRKIFADYMSKYEAYSNGSEAGIKLALAKKEVHCPTDKAAINDSLRNSAVKEVPDRQPTNGGSNPSTAIQQ